MGYWPLAEAEAIVWELLCEVTGLSKSQLLQNRTHLTHAQMHMLDVWTTAMATGTPMQHVLGKAGFMDFEVRVSPAVLIPRPETEELADWIIRTEKKAGLSVLDLCTGSGCIALALARSGRWRRVSGLDVSAEALQLAKVSAHDLALRVHWLEIDILQSPDFNKEKWDVWVSNPPYILEDEKAAMENHVLHHEPHLALFVPQAQPIVFYEKIAALGLLHLHPGGRLYFELNPKTAGSVAAMLQQKGYKEVELKLDMQGKQRMARAVRG